ncbi:hypothetical protein FOZ61_005959 [Perkinsus olseni]|uniref:Uncharacterized protein n=1 Tax=Perkinsus olseni TaxID=32597 RepID=A0A7J6MBE8_PEROL|nr:hypothetical protein FOZ61_005959 [Perkinsus olseni]KAF4674427.1 hypothetical protein FOL46_004989 [Perkinsus olseni]
MCFTGLTTAQKRAIPRPTMEAAFDLLRDRRYLDLSALDMSGAVVSFGVYSDAFLEELLSWQIDQGPSVYGQFPPLLTQSLWVAKGKLHRRAVEEYVDFAAGCLAETDGVGDILSNLKPGEMYNLLEVFGSNSDKRTWQRAFEEVCNFVARDVYLSHLSLRDLAMIMAAFVRSKGSIEAPGLSHVMPRLTGTVSTLLSSGGSAGRIRPDWAALIANAIAKALLHPADDKVRLVMSRLLSETLKDGKEPDNIAKVYLAAAKLELLPPTSSSHWLHSRINISVAALTMLMLSAALSRSTQLFRAVVLVLARRAFTDDLSEACKYQIITGMLGMWPVSDPTLEELKAVRGVLNGVRLADLQASSSSFAQIASTRDHVGCLETLRGSLHGSNGSVSPPYHIVTEAFALPYWIDIVMLPIGRSTGESKSSVLRPTNYQHATSKFLESPFRAEPQANSS